MGGKSLNKIDLDAAITALNAGEDIGAVANAFGISKSSLYRYAKDKAEIKARCAKAVNKALANTMSAMLSRLNQEEQATCFVFISNIFNQKYNQLDDNK